MANKPYANGAYKDDKLISANALLEKVQFRIEAKGVVDATVRDVVGLARKLIDEAPAVDAVEVVRCKDCKSWQHTGDGIGDCMNERYAIPPFCNPSMDSNDYCCLGERRGQDGR